MSNISAFITGKCNSTVLECAKDFVVVKEKGHTTITTRNKKSQLLRKRPYNELSEDECSSNPSKCKSKKAIIANQCKNFRQNKLM